MQPKSVSVILTTFNGAKYITKQIESILNQTVPPDEIIVCDDCSTDDSVAILKSYADNNIMKLYVNEQQLGVVENFKKAAKLAQPANYLAFADQDDIWLPGKLKRLKEEMLLIDDDNTPALIYTDLTVIDREDKIIEPSFWARQKIRPGKVRLATLLYGNVVTGCTMMINEALANEFFLMNNSKYLHDEWLALIAYSFGKVKQLEEQLVLYRQHESNVTFAEGFEPIGLRKKLNNEFSYLTGKKRILTHQFNLAADFLTYYKGKLGKEQTDTIQKFIKLRDKSYLLQRVIRRITYSS